MYKKATGDCGFSCKSASMIPSKLTNALLGPVFGSSYSLIKNSTFAKAQFRALHMKDSFFEDYYRDTCKITKTDMLAFLKASTSYSLKASAPAGSPQIHVLAGKKKTALYGSQ